MQRQHMSSHEFAKLLLQYKDRPIYIASEETDAAGIPTLVTPVVGIRFDVVPDAIAVDADYHCQMEWLDAVENK